jgi:hypothetical protein
LEERMSEAVKLLVDRLVGVAEPGTVSDILLALRELPDGLMMRAGDTPRSDGAKRRGRVGDFAARDVWVRIVDELIEELKHRR